MGDINGDKLLDVVVAGSRTVECFVGQGGGLVDTMASCSIAIDTVAEPVGALGDVNGDRIADYLDGGTYDARPSVFLGGSDGLRATRRYAMPVPSRAATITLADVDCDGAAEAVVGLAQDSSAALLPTAYVWKWSTDHMALVGSVTGIGRAPFPPNPAVANIGDVNGDGCGDVMLFGYFLTGAGEGLPSASLFLGSPSGLNATPLWRIGAAEHVFPLGAYALGDVDGNGADDFLFVDLSAKDACGLVGFRGLPAAGPDRTPVWRATCDGGPVDYLGYSVADLNGDRRADLLAPWGVVYFGARGAPPGPFGGSGAVEPLPSGSVIATGDVNGDTCDDVLAPGGLDDPPASMVLYSGGDPGPRE